MTPIRRAFDHCKTVHRMRTCQFETVKRAIASTDRTPRCHPLMLQPYMCVCGKQQPFAQCQMTYSLMDTLYDPPNASERRLHQSMFCLCAQFRAISPRFHFTLKVSSLCLDRAQICTRFYGHARTEHVTYCGVGHFTVHITGHNHQIGRQF